MLKLLCVITLMFTAFNPTQPSVLVGTCFDRTQETAVAKRKEMTDAITAKYKSLDRQMVKQVVDLAHKYQQPTFPRAKDIVAIIGIESNFNPSAVSKLKRDPAIGLTQIRPGAWSHKLKKSDLNDIEGQVKHGSEILGHYYKVLDGNKAGAIRAYNIGIGNYLRGKQQDAADRYLAKYSKEVVAYQKIEARYAR